MKPAIVESTRPGRIVFLDYLRIFAFSSVLIGHRFYEPLAQLAQDGQALHATPRLLLSCLLPLLREGGAGVVVFFLVSGYIITHVLQSERAAEFAVKRIFRIYPLYIAAVLLEMLAKRTVTEWTTLVPQLLLVGDFFGTPYALGGIEWTLRIELMFYGFMGVLRAVGLLHGRHSALPWVLLLATLSLLALAPIPSGEGWSTAYVTMYMPFLFLGGFFYMREQRRVSVLALAGFALLVLFQYVHLVARFQPAWMDAHFAPLACLLFVVAWRLGPRLPVTAGVLYVSDLTYSVYLFHNWSWRPISNALKNHGPGMPHNDLQVLVILLVGCMLALKLIEKPGIRLGRRLAGRVRESGERRVPTSRTDVLTRTQDRDSD